MIKYDNKSFGHKCPISFIWLDCHFNLNHRGIVRKFKEIFLKKNVYFRLYGWVENPLKILDYNNQGFMKIKFI